MKKTKLPYHVMGDMPDQPIPETPMPESDPKPWKETKVVGKKMPKVDAYERVSGSAQFTYDVMLPNMLYAAVLRSPHANSVLKSIDVSEAEKMPGVHAVITRHTKEADIAFPYNEDKLFATNLKYAGDEVAAVAAETPYQASDALKKIKVEYEVLDFAVNVDSAMKDGAPVIQKAADPNKEHKNEYYGANNLILNPNKPYARGDVEVGFNQADEVIKSKYSTPHIMHTPVETHGSVCRWDGGKLTIWDSIQGIYTTLNGVSAILKLPYNNIHAIGKYVGGAFGAKLYVMKHQIICALLAKITAQPVKLMTTRETSFLAVGNRPNSFMKFRIGAKKDGTITAIEHKHASTSGAYLHTESTYFQSAELYKCDNVKIENLNYLTNAGKSCAFRAPGFPNASFGLEQALDELAEKLKMDPVELRLKNVPLVSQRAGGMPYTSTGCADCLKEGAKAFGWDKKAEAKANDDHIKTGYGVAGGMWAYGGGWPPSTIILKMYVDGSLTIRTGASDIGTGTKPTL